MKFKIALATATAMSLLMGGALADDNNRATVDQNGDQNSALIDQSDGSGNFFGTPANAPSSPWGLVIQNGDNNELDATQSGSGNNVANWKGGTANVKQTGDRNVLTIVQENQAAGNGNAIWNVNQTSNEGSVATNSASVVQTNGGSGNARHGVGSINQTQNLQNVGSVADTNTIDIFQSGAGSNLGNAILNTTQTGSGNSQDVDQIGTKNYINAITQTGPGNSLNATLSGDQNALFKATQANSGGNANSATVSLTGNQNGTGAAGNIQSWPAFHIPGGGTTGYTSVISGFEAGSVASGVAGVTQAEISQNGVGNILGYNATGNFNRFGLAQDGASNDINATVTGDSHQLAILQDGDGNVTDILQTGTGNDAGIDIDGGYNKLNVRQDQLGASGNTMSVSITGSDNNNYPVSPALSGAADAVRDGLTTALIQGDLFQEGSNNALTVTVSTSSNAFAALQDGDNNVATHIISGGNGNQAVIAQVGNGNVSDTSQMGANNNIGISQ